MSLPKHIEYLIIGAGIHGLSTAWHLAKKIKAKGTGDGSKILTKTLSPVAQVELHVELFVIIIINPQCES